MKFCELQGVALDEAVALALNEPPGADYSTSWHHGGPLIDRFQIHLAGPQSPVHRNGGPKSGWGESGMWTATSWRLLRANGKRSLGYHDTSPLTAAMRLVVSCNTPEESA